MSCLTYKITILPGFCGGLHCPKQTTLPPDYLHPISAIIWRNSQKIFEVTIECAITSCQTIPWMFTAVIKHFVLCWHSPTSWCINFRSHLRSPNMAIKSWFINEYYCFFVLLRGRFKKNSCIHFARLNWADFQQSTCSDAHFNLIRNSFCPFLMKCMLNSTCSDSRMSQIPRLKGMHGFSSIIWSILFNSDAFFSINSPPFIILINNGLYCIFINPRDLSWFIHCSTIFITLKLLFLIMTDTIVYRWIIVSNNGVSWSGSRWFRRCDLHSPEQMCL